MGMIQHPWDQDIVESKTVYFSAAMSSRTLSVHVGGTSWEAEGFVAVVDHSTCQLLWLLHLSASESFTEVKIEGDTICAQSGGYPECFRWRIPMSAPEALSVVRC